MRRRSRGAALNGLDWWRFGGTCLLYTIVFGWWFVYEHTLYARTLRSGHAMTSAAVPVGRKVRTRARARVRLGWTFVIRALQGAIGTLFVALGLLEGFDGGSWGSSSSPSWCSSPIRTAVLIAIGVALVVLLPPRTYAGAARRPGGDDNDALVTTRSSRVRWIVYVISMGVAAALFGETLHSYVGGRPSGGRGWKWKALGALGAPLLDRSALLVAIVVLLSIVACVDAPVAVADDPREAFAGCAGASLPSNVVARYKGRDIDTSEDEGLDIKSKHTSIDRRYASCNGAYPRPPNEDGLLMVDPVQPEVGDAVWIETDGRYVMGFVQEVDAAQERVQVRMDRVASLMEQLRCLDRSGVVHLEHPKWKQRKVLVHVDPRASTIRVRDDVDPLKDAAQRRTTSEAIAQLIKRYDMDNTLDVAELSGIIDKRAGRTDQTKQRSAADSAAVKGATRLEEDLADAIVEARRGADDDEQVSTTAIFKRFDSDSDGALTVQEVTDMLRYMGFVIDPPTEGASGYPEYVVVRADADDDATTNGLRIDMRGEETFTNVRVRPYTVGPTPCFFTPTLFRNGEAYQNDPYADDDLRWFAMDDVRRRPSGRLVEHCFQKASEDILDNEEVPGETVGRVILEHVDGREYRCRYTSEDEPCRTSESLWIFHGPSASWYPLADELDAQWARDIRIALERGDREVRGVGYTVAYNNEEGATSASKRTNADVGTVRLFLTLDRSTRSRVDYRTSEGTSLQRRYDENVPYDLAFFASATDARGGTGGDRRGGAAAASRFTYTYDVNDIEARVARLNEFLGRCDAEVPKNPDYEFQTECQKKAGRAGVTRSCPTGCDGDIVKPVRSAGGGVDHKTTRRLVHYCRNPDELKKILPCHTPAKRAKGGLWPVVSCPKAPPKKTCKIPLPMSKFEGGICPLVRDAGECSSLSPTCGWKTNTIVGVTPNNAGEALGVGARVRSNYKGEGKMYNAEIVQVYKGDTPVTAGCNVGTDGPYEYDLKYDDPNLGMEYHVQVDRCVYLTSCKNPVMTPRGYEAAFGDGDALTQERSSYASTANVKRFNQGHDLPTVNDADYDQLAAIDNALEQQPLFAGWSSDSTVDAAAIGEQGRFADPDMDVSTPLLYDLTMHPTALAYTID